MRCAGICHFLYRKGRPFTDYPEQVAMMVKGKIYMGDINHSKNFAAEGRDGQKGETERQTDGQTERRRDGETERQRDEETERRTDGQTERRRDRETVRQRDEETERRTY